MFCDDSGQLKDVWKVFKTCWQKLEEGDAPWDVILSFEPFQSFLNIFLSRANIKSSYVTDKAHSKLTRFLVACSISMFKRLRSDRLVLTYVSSKQLKVDKQTAGGN